MKRTTQRSGLGQQLTHLLVLAGLGLMPILLQACSDDYINPLDTRYRAPEEVYSEQAWRAYAAGNAAQAQQDFEHVLTIKPDYADALSGLGWISLEQMDTQAARGHFENALGTQEQHLLSQLGLASVAWLESDYADCTRTGEMALGQLDQGASAEPLPLTSRDVHLMLAQAYYALSQSESAFEHLQALGTQDFSPEHPDFEHKLLEAIETIQLEN